jgi:hypothetical protein
MATNKPLLTGGKLVAAEILALRGTTIKCSENTRKLMKNRGKDNSQIEILGSVGWDSEKVMK